uniref:Putative glycosyl hydrolase n=1 Tax=Desulfovibrio sp. U5L TaxID=596152 RepID=I2PYW9_9BACT
MGRHKLHVLKAARAARRGLPRARGLWLAFFLLAWAAFSPSGRALAQAASPTGPAGPAAAGRLSAWIADWDLTRGLAEWRAHPGLFDEIRVFAAYFDEKDRPYLAPEWAALLGSDARAVFGRTPVFLTVVNDLVTASGQGNRLKDPELARRLVSGPEARARHIATLLALAARYGFSGLEIDYEEVPAPVWPEFLLFVSELQTQARARGLALSVLLQPQRRYLAAPLPAGPDYVLMGYNLFGSHSGPGPKATPAFLAEQAAALRALGALEATGLALSTGGFDWTGGKAARQLDEAEAGALLARTKAATTRSADDGYLVSRYRDGKGQDHEVWHADAKTLATLWTAARSAGFGRLVVWRLGGNPPALFDWLATLKH